MREQGKPKSRFAESFRKTGTSLLKLFGGDFPVFLLFLAITFFFWWSQTMNQDFQAEIKVPVKVADIPDEVRMTVPPVSQISVSLSGKGLALRKSGRIGGRNVLSVSNSDFNMNQGRASVSTGKLKESLSAFLPTSVTVSSITPDSLVYQYMLQRNVMLPVEFDGTTESQDQFFLERIVFEPDSIIASILVSDTAGHHARAVAGQIVLSADTIVKTVSIRPEQDVLFGADEVKMTVISQQYTEKSIEVPIVGVHFPDYISLKSFPSKAVVTAWVKMSEYDKVTASDFQVVVDYNDIAGSDASKARLRIFSQPANVRNVRLQTRSVDYLMEARTF